MHADFGILNSTFSSFELSTCASNPKYRSRGSNDFPVVLLSPRLGNSRLMYGAMAQSLASQGFVVITMDHAYDGAVVEYPDKSIALANDIKSDTEVEADLHDCQQDVSFNIAQVQNCSIRHKLFQDIAGTKFLNKIVMAGHSLGGANAAATMQVDHRIAAGVNIDGRFFSSVMQKGTPSPSMITSCKGHNITTEPTWAEAWPNMTGSKLFMPLKYFTHGNFTNMLLLADTAGVSGCASEAIGDKLGAVEGVRADSFINAFVGQFSNFVLEVSNYTLPADMVKHYPEAVVLDKQIRKQCD